MMSDLEQKVKKNWKNTVKEELIGTALLYREIISKPQLLVQGTYNVLRDVFYELPRSLISKNQPLALEERLDKRASQALTISEIVAVPGTIAGGAAFKLLGADDHTAAIFGGAIGNYVSGAGSYALSYNLLSRNELGYSSKGAWIDSGKVIKDCFPAVIALYVADAGILSGLMAVGASYGLAMGFNIALGTIIFTGVAKHSAHSNAITY